jgi:FkbM family methyltransferase
MITREHVLWAYRLFMDREPENEEVLNERLRQITNTRDLRANFMLSAEFGRNNPQLAMTESNIVIKEIDGGLRLFVDLADHVIGWGVIRGAYEQLEIDFMKRTVKPGETVLDVGAHIGLFTITAANLVGQEGKVYSFEPLPQNRSLLERSVIENGFTHRVVVEQAAVSDHTGVARMNVPDYTTNSGGAHLLAVDGAVQPDHVATKVSLVQLDAYRLRRPVSFIKIDIEGAEPLALRGATELLRSDRPVILSEIHPAQLSRVCGYTPERFISEVKGYGYEGYSPTKNGLAPLKSAQSDEVRSIVFLPKK